MRRRSIAALTAAIMMLAFALPAHVFGASGPRFDTPAGYNGNDYQKMVSFLEIEDEAGIKNGEKLSAGYDPELPETWTDGAGARIEWFEGDSGYRIEKIFFDGSAFVGALDLSGCAMLEEVNMANARLLSIDLTGTDISYFDAINTEGAGRLAYIQTEYSEEDCIWYCGAAVAVPNEGAAFIGWFTADGEYITSDLVLEGARASSPNVTARFTREGEEWTYSTEDCEKLRAFLEIEDAYGIKNGTKLSPDYDPEAPATWSGVEWRYVSGVLYLRKIAAYNKNLYGSLDVSGCVWLESLVCGTNGGITEINVTGCSSLSFLSCSQCAITVLALTGCSSIESIYVSNNPLTSLDAADCPRLKCIHCLNTGIKELDFSNNPRVGFNSIKAEGNGSIGVYYMGAPMWEYIAEAYSEDGAAFLGWYSENGVFITGETSLWYREHLYKNVIARFEGGLFSPVPGDANNDGDVTLTDALLVLRHAMSLAELPDEAVPSCDVNSDGMINTLDALLVLREAMGLIVLAPPI